MAIFKFNLELRKELLIQISKIDNLIDCAKRFKVNPKTLYVELTQKSVLKPNKFSCNKCLNRVKCTHFNIEIENNLKEDFIKLKQCDLLENPLCNRLKHFPYVCNNCENKHQCKLLKRYYDPIAAQELTDKIKVKSRKVLKLNHGQIMKIDPIITHGVKLGQSLKHIYETDCFIKALISYVTLKRYMYAGYFTVKAYMLPMKVRFDVIRKTTIQKMNRLIDKREDHRSFLDFIAFCNENQIGLDYWEYDSVEGKKKDTKMILTITYVEFDFQFGILYEKYNYNDVLIKIRQLQNLLGEKYWKIFKVNLSDNGQEFDRFTEIEFDHSTGEVKCNTFFTRPHVPTDKADCESNHRLVRRILPKHESIDWLTQEQCNILFSHINGLVRESKNNKTPYELFVERFGKEVADLLGIKHVNPKDVCLKPFLLKKN